MHKGYHIRPTGSSSSRNLTRKRRHEASRDTLMPPCTVTAKRRWSPSTERFSCEQGRGTGYGGGLRRLELFDTATLYVDTIHHSHKPPPLSSSLPSLPSLSSAFCLRAVRLLGCSGRLVCTMYILCYFLTTISRPTSHFLNVFLTVTVSKVFPSILTHTLIFTL